MLPCPLHVVPQVTEKSFEIRSAQLKEVYHSTHPTLIPYIKLFGSASYLAVNCVDLKDGLIYCQVLHAPKGDVLKRAAERLSLIQSEARQRGERIPDFIHTDGTTGASVRCCLPHHLRI